MEFDDDDSDADGGGAPRDDWDRRPPPEANGDGGRDRPDLVRVGLIFYGVMLAVALVWRTGFYGESIIFASPSDEADGVHLVRDLGLGLLSGMAVVGISHLLTSSTQRGEALARALGRSIGQVGVPDLLLLALASGMAEEAFFRGALQPRVGLVLASVLFGCVHFVPRRDLVPWAGFAIVAGLFFGVLFDWTGNLLAPVTAHVVVNAVNLPLLARRYGADEAPSSETDLAE